MAAVLIGQASGNEFGGISGGKRGDQTGGEVAVSNWYLHSYGWYILRPKSSDAAEKIAKAMEMACANNNIGYCQDHRDEVWSASAGTGYDPSRISYPVECDCSSLVRLCCLYAGISVGDFYTGNEKDVLMSTGKFDLITDTAITNTQKGARRGDILLTRLRAHTAVVLTDGSSIKPSSPSPSPAPTSWKATGTAVASTNGARIRSTPSDADNFNILMELGYNNRFEVDGQKSGKWVHCKEVISGTIGWISEKVIKYDGEPSPEPIAPAPGWKAIGTATCSAPDGANVYPGPGTGNRYGRIGYTNRFEVDGQKSGDWIHVKVAGMGIGYIHKDRVKYD